MNDAEKLSAAVAQLDALRVTLRNEPASDWFVDAKDFAARDDMDPSQRLAGAMRLLSIAWSRLEGVELMGSLVIEHERWLEIAAPAALPSS